MPHVIVEYSANLEEDVSPRDLIDRIHATILATGVYPIGGVRVRAERRDLYAIADRDPSRIVFGVCLPSTRELAGELLPVADGALAGAPGAR